jgi:dipeptide/tripeptide permease
VGTLLAVVNFALLCLTIQKAAETEDKKQMKAKFQLSYNARLIAQALWVLAAFLLPCFQTVAAALPLLFPTLVIFFLNKQGKLVTPSDRKNPAPEEEEGERLESTEA